MQAVTGGAQDGSTAATAITVKVANADFTSASTLTPLLQGIAGYYVNLEIISGSGATFPNLYTVTSGVTKDRILSLALPATVTAVAAGTYNSISFNGFTGLTSILPKAQSRSPLRPAATSKFSIMTINC